MQIEDLDEFQGLTVPGPQYWREQPRKGSRWQTQALEQRFQSRVQQSGAEECWKWLGYKDQRGYGIIYDAYGKPVKAHRYAWELENQRKIPSGQVMRHLCGVPGCVNPRHLRPGTQRENAQDMVKHGRAHLAKLTEDDVISARHKHYIDGRSIYGLAKEYGITRQGMRHLIRGLTWRHVPMTSTANSTRRPEKDGVML